MNPPAPQKPHEQIEGLTAALEAARDFADRAHQALDRQRQFFEKAQEVAGIGSWIFELDGSGHLTWSREMYRILGRPMDGAQIHTSAMTDYIHPDDRDVVRTAHEAAVATGQPCEIEHRVVGHDEVVRWVRTRADIVRDPDGRTIRMVGTLQDITGQRQLEDQLRQSQKLEAIGRLAGGISHDLNNALTIVIGYAELVSSALAEDDPVRIDVLEIRRAAERAESVTRQLLTFSRKQWLEPRAIQLGELVANQARMLGRLLGTSIELVTIVEPNLPLIYGDPGQVEQAIVNLAVNARDAMPNGGTMTVQAASMTLDAAFARAHPSTPAGSYVQLSVTDTGEGMTAETLEHIFDPFFTTKAIGRGTGLGLSMVYGTMKQSGGLVLAESEPQRGSTFRLYFPALPAQSISARQTTQRTGDADRPTILVVDDEQGVRRLAVAALAKSGYRILQAESGNHALQVAAEAGGIDVLLTDLSMPEMTGFELAAALAQTRSGLRVIVMSGYVAEHRPVPNLEYPTAFLPKPFTPRALRQKLLDVLGATDNQLE